VPAAALTALAGDQDRKRALRSGFQIHEAKPIDAARLAAIVSKLVDWDVAEKPPEKAPQEREISP
jgi:CheY-like chemotaxis protein